MVQVWEFIKNKWLTARWIAETFYFLFQIIKR